MTNNETHESVIDMRWEKINGKDVLMKKVRYQNGNTEWKNIDEPPHDSTDAFDARFADSGTTTIPLDLEPAKTDVLVRKSIEHVENPSPDARTPLMIEYMDKLLKIHAILIRVLGGQPTDILTEKRVIDFKDNQALREMTILLINVVGDPWTDVLKFIK